MCLCIFSNDPVSHQYVHRGIRVTTQRIARLFIVASALLVTSGAIVRAATSDEGLVVKGSGPRVYVIEHGQRRWIETWEDYQFMGFIQHKIKNIDDRTLITYSLANSVTKKTGYPDHTLLKTPNGPLYMMEQGRRRLVRYPQALRSAGLVSERAITIGAVTLMAIPEGQVVPTVLLYGPETSIAAGPNDESQVDDAEVTFRFLGNDAHGSTAVRFETKLDGVDKQWVNVGARSERKISLPSGQATYVFFVRSVDHDGVVDDSPAFRRFRVRRSAAVGSVRIVSVSRGSEDPGSEYITLEVTGNKSVDLLGWRVGNDTGNTMSLGKLQYFYQANSTVLDSPVLLPGHRLVVVSGRSPLGRNIRLNRCFGFYSPQYSLVPSVRSSCPRPTALDLEGLTRACRTYINGLNSCRAPLPVSDVDQRRLGRTCIEYAVEHFNYEGCTRAHSGEPDFFLDEYRMYLGLTEELWSDEGDRAVLYDPDGQIIDTRTY